MSSTINSFDKNEIIMDRYEILAEIGSGGFATTYKAMDHSLDIPVAIKAFHKHTGASMDEAVKEAKIAAGLYELEGIASARDFFWYKETPCIIMDYVDGTSIKDYVREHGRIRGDKMLILIKPLLQSLIKIHEKGILHRDISADNILLTEDGRLKLIDFGAARLSQNAQGDEYTIIFKRGFAPIEQCSAGGKQGPWTDVYGICATMYYMITGIVPDDSVSRLIEDKLLPLERIDGVRLTPQAMSCIMKGLAVRPEKRFQSMSEFYTALYAAKPSTLANILNNTTIQGGKVENGEANFTEKLLEDMELSISHKKSRRKKQIIIGAVVAVLLILSGSIWGILQHRSTVKDQIPHAPASSITPAINSTSAEPDADLHSSDNPADADADSTDTPANAPDDPGSSNTPANQPGNSGKKNGSGNSSGNSGKNSGGSSGNSGSGKNSRSSSGNSGSGNSGSGNSGKNSGGNSGSGKNFGSSSSRATTSKKSGSGNSGKNSGDSSSKATTSKKSGSGNSGKNSGGSSSKATTSKKSGSGSSSGSAKSSGGSSSKATTTPKKSNTAPKKTAKPASPKNNFDGDLDGI